MLDPTLVPTPLVLHHERAPVTIADTIRRVRFPTMRVVLTFSGLMLGNVARRITRRDTAAARAKRLREAFEHLGGLWIKMGQLLSLRTDVFSRETCEELAKLQFGALGFPMSQVRDEIESSLGRQLESVFSRFEEAPIAAASVSQVHRAVLRETGATVAVKVLRPHVEESFSRDMRNLSRVISIFEWVGFAPHVHWRQALEQLEQMMNEELDLRYEAANMRRMRKNLRHHRVYVARVFRDLSGVRLLVSEFVPGVLMSDFIRVGQREPERFAAWCKQNRVDPRKFGRRLFGTAMRQLLEDRLFHADLHPGNIMLLKDNRLALLDFGTVGSLDHTFLSAYRRSLEALAAHDYQRAADTFLRLAISPPPIDELPAVRRELVATYREWDSLSHLDGTSYHDRSMATAGANAGQVMFKHRVQLSWDFMRVSRTWATLDASLSFLMPDANYMKLFGRYFRDAQARRNKPAVLARRFVGGLRQAISTVDEYNELIGPAIRRYTLLSSTYVNASERMVRLVRMYLRTTANLLLVATGFIGLGLLHRFYPHLLPFESEILYHLFDDHITEQEIWWVAGSSILFAVYLLRRSLRGMRTAR